jgi:protein O-mannosyl-transferase
MTRQTGLPKTVASRPESLAAPRPTHPSFSLRPSFLISVFLFLATLVLYAPSRNYQFLNFDDEDYVTHNNRIAEGLTPRSIAWALTTMHASNWHPLTWLSLEVDAQVYGVGQPAGFHMTNAIIHAFNVVLLYWLMLTMTHQPWPSALVAALFGWHPLRVESVAWVSERKDVLSAFFWLLTMLAYVRYAKGPSLSRYALVLLLFAAGLAAKPMLVTLPFVLLLLDYWPLGRMAATAASRRDPRSALHASRLRLFLEKLPFWAFSGASSLITVIAQERGGAINALSTLPFDLRWRNALVSYVVYLRKMLWPVDLAPYYPHPGAAISNSEVLTAALILIAISILVWRYARRRPYLPVGWFWYLVALLPVIGIIQVGPQAYADRYTYLPMVGIYLMAAWGLKDLAWTLRWPVAAAVLIGTAASIACLVVSSVQLEYWKDSVTLWKHTAAVTPVNYKLEVNYGAALAAEKDWYQAQKHLRRAIDLDPAPADAYFNLAQTIGRQGRAAEAVPNFQKALELRPRFPKANNGLGMTLLGLGNLNQAIEQLRIAVNGQPDSALYHYNLGQALLQAGERTEASQHLQAALRLNPRLTSPREASSVAIPSPR